MLSNNFPGFNGKISATIVSITLLFSSSISTLAVCSVVASFVLFVISAIKKGIQPSNLTKAITIGLKNTKTSMDLKEAMYFGTKLAGLKDENINAYSVVGEDEIIDGIWYFKHDAKATKELIRNLYLGIKPITDDQQD